MKILDIGCGKNKIKGAIGIDISPNSDADIIHDLNKFPYPIADSAFDEIYCLDVLEHLEDVMAVMHEVNRIGKIGAKVFIRVPHFSSYHAFTDLTHKHFFSSQSFKYFTDGEYKYSHYTSAKFRKEKIKLNFRRWYRMLGIHLIANSNLLMWEQTFVFWFPAENLEAVLTVVK